MNCRLTRNQYKSDGIFGELRDIANKLIAITLEHAYPVCPDLYIAKFEPKVPPGTYTCVRGFHRLDGMESVFPTFEIAGVPGHSGILFHWGNFNRDSEGCVLLGEAISIDYDQRMITNSRIVFSRFMKLQDGIDSFQLTVS